MLETMTLARTKPWQYEPWDDEHNRPNGKADSVKFCHTSESRNPEKSKSWTLVWQL